MYMVRWLHGSYSPDDVRILSVGKQPKTAASYGEYNEITDDKYGFESTKRGYLGVRFLMQPLECDCSSIWPSHSLVGLTGGGICRITVTRGARSRSGGW